MEDSQKKQIKKLVEGLVAALGQKGAVEVGEQEESVLVELTLEEPQLFIGERGQTLAEVQHLVRLMARKQIPDIGYVTVDINQYKKSKEQHLRELALEAADEVSLLKKPKELAAMSAAERRIVHMALAERTDVTSESEGEDDHRRIVIKPA